MYKIFRFFLATPKDLSMQKVCMSEIAEGMETTDENKMRLPRSFANAMRRILEAEEVHKMDNTAPNRTP